MTIEYGTQTIEFEIQKSQKAKNSYITVERDTGVLVKAPETLSNEEIKVLVKSKAKWILSKLKQLGSSVDYGEIKTGSRLFYLGKSYYVGLLPQDIDTVEVTFIHSKFKIYIPFEVDQDRLKGAIELFYKNKAQEKITKLLKKHSDIMKLYPTDINFKKSKTKWGSCSEQNKITFNPELIKLSSSLIEYAIVHELAHIKYKNHSKDFWDLVKKYMADYLKKEESLRAFERKV